MPAPLAVFARLKLWALHDFLPQVAHSGLDFLMPSSSEHWPSSIVFGVDWLIFFAWWTQNVSWGFNSDYFCSSPQNFFILLTDSSPAGNISSPSKLLFSLSSVTDCSLVSPSVYIFHRLQLCGAILFKFPYNSRSITFLLSELHGDC